jgi:hypothetical protein
VVPVINHKGQQIAVQKSGVPADEAVPVRRRLWNCPWAYFFKDKPFVIVDWTDAIKECKTKAAANKKGINGLKGDLLYRKLLTEMIARPIDFEGHKFYGCYYWGSAIKNSQSYGVTEDVLVNMGFIKHAEDAQRIGRSHFVNGMYGGAVYKKPKVLVLPPHSVWKGYRIEDGAGLASKSKMLHIKREGMNETIYAEPMQSMYAWQRFPWRDIAEPAMELIVENLERIKNIGLDPSYILAQVSDYKKSLVQADAQMLKHPYLTASIGPSTKRAVIELATTVPLPAKMGYAVPTLCENDFCWPEGDETALSILFTFPQDDWASIRAISRHEHRDKEWAAESKRLLEQQAIQYTLTGLKWTVKGVFQLVPDDVMSGYDFIVCSKDIKVYPDLGNLRDEAEAKGKVDIRPGETVLAITQWIGPGQCVGCPHDIWEAMGRDYDGDLVQRNEVPAKARAIWKAAKDWRGLTSTYKIPKTKSELELRPHMIVNSLLNIIGFATKVMANTFAVEPEERMLIAEELNYKSVGQMDFYLNSWIKIGTDLYKVMVDTAKVEQSLHEAQQMELRVIRKSAPWTSWRNNDWAFEREVPDFEDNLPDDQVQRAMNDKEYRRSPQWTMHIQSRVRRCTIARIFEFVRPWIVAQYEAKMVNGIILDGAQPDFMDNLKPMALSDFIDWAPTVPPDMMDKAYKWHERYCHLASQINWSSLVAAEAFKETWMVECAEWAKQFPSEKMAAYAYWRADHHARGSALGASGVFVGFPELALEIVKDKPGTAILGSQMRTIVIGLSRQFNYSPDTLGPILVDVKMLDIDGMTRKALVAHEHIDGMVNNEFPNLVGIVARLEKSHGDDVVSPPTGTYVANFVRWRGESWGCYLTKSE